MSTLARYDRPGTLERVTDSTAFAVLFGMASVVLAPVVLLGLVVLPGVILGKAGMQLSDDLGLLLPYGGLIGYVGIFRARRPSTSAADHWATLVCLVAGVATATTLIGGFIAIGAGVDWFAAGAIAVLSLPIVAALGRIARLRRLRAAAEGYVPDSLPLIFLTIAIGEALCAIAIGVRLAIAG
jgi:hypothetical protein